MSIDHENPIGGSLLLSTKNGVREAQFLLRPLALADISHDR